MNYNKSKQKKHTVRKKMNSTSAAPVVGTKTSSARKTKKFKIVERKKLDPALSDYNEFRLFDFQAYDYRNTDTKVTSYNFQIRMFGINTVGETCVLFVNNFRPFFYIQVPSNFNQIRADDLFIYYRDHANIPKYLRSEFVHAQLESHQKLYEFTGSTSYKFLKLTFKTTRAFRQCKMLLSSKTLDSKMRYPTYESNIPPLLRYFHIYNISPSGWVRLDHKETIPCEIKTSQCTYEYICSTRQIHPLPAKETPVPYKIASFDIEASSSHGDFPLPVKDYKRLASQIIDLIEAKKQKQSLSYKAIQLILKKSIKAAFGVDTVDDIDCVYPKNKPTKERINQLCERFITMTIADDSIQNQNNPLIKAAAEAAKVAEAAAATEGTNENNGENGDHEKMAVEFGSSYTKKDDSTVVYSKEDLQKTIGQYLLNSKHTREQKIHTVNTALSAEHNGFPTLKGDEITFIGTTFLKNGSMEPYKNHCLVVNSCTPVEGVEIVSVPDEKQCILNWADLIQQEDPDIIIGYNIFGFDYQFMFQRAKELSIVEEFCMLSRINNEVCAKQDYKTQEYKLDHTQNRLASGDYDLHYPCISGRLQIDLLFYFRRDYNLSSYKLDDVAGTMIRDDIKGLEIRKADNQTRLYSKNLAGLHVGDFIHLEITSFTTDYYADGRKFRVLQIDRDVTVDESLMSLLMIPTGTYNVITIEGLHTALNPKTQNLKWGMAKDDVSPQDIFRLSKESADSRAIVAKYCIQDCNLVHHLMKKVDVLTGYNEMSRICNVPISFLVFRGQGIKLTSYVAKVCREKDTLMPDLEKIKNDDGYEGAIVLPPKCEMYGENPVACVDYSSLYPSIAKGWNLSPNSKVWTKTFDLTGKLIKINNYIVTEKNCDILLEKAAKHDNLSNYKYINVTFDNYEQVKKFDKNGKLLKTEKVKSGYKEVRWAKFPTGQEGIIPCIIGDLLKARKETRKKAESEPDPFLANILDKRQLGYKVTANSLYGQMGSSVSTFFEKDVAASITSIGRQMITYAKRMVEEIYGNSVYELKSGTGVRVVGTKSQYVYGDTDSVFFTFNLEDPKTGAPIRGKDALEITIEIAQEAANLCSLFLPPPMKLAYEKTLMSFILLSKKRYVGMLYEFNPNKGKLKFMGLPLKRRDSCDYLKDVYGGILTILMKEPDNVQKAIEFLNHSLQSLVDGSVSIDKLALTKSLRSNYKNPLQIAHKVLADRVGEREPGNKPKPGDRIKYAFIENKGQKLLGDRVETLDFIAKHELPLDYHYYITNQLMNPLLQLFSLALDKVYIYKKFKQKQIVELNKHLDKMYEDCDGLIEPYMKKREKYCSGEVKKLLFDPFLTKIYNAQNGIRTIMQFWGKA